METGRSCEPDWRMEVKRWKKGEEGGQRTRFGKSGGTSSLVCASPPLCVSSSFFSSLF